MPCRSKKSAISAASSTGHGDDRAAARAGRRRRTISVSSAGGADGRGDDRGGPPSRRRCTPRSTAATRRTSEAVEDPRIEAGGSGSETASRAEGSGRSEPLLVRLRDDGGLILEDDAGPPGSSLRGLADQQSGRRRGGGTVGDFRHHAEQPARKRDHTKGGQEMNSYETTIETTASTEQVLAVLTDPSAIRSWSPVPFELEVRPGRASRPVGGLASAARWPGCASASTSSSTPPTRTASGSTADGPVAGRRLRPARSRRRQRGDGARLAGRTRGFTAKLIGKATEALLQRGALDGAAPGSQPPPRRPGRSARQHAGKRPCRAGTRSRCRAGTLPRGSAPARRQRRPRVESRSTCSRAS